MIYSAACFDSMGSSSGWYLNHIKEVYKSYMLYISAWWRPHEVETCTWVYHYFIKVCFVCCLIVILCYHLILHYTRTYAIYLLPMWLSWLFTRTETITPYTINLQAPRFLYIGQAFRCYPENAFYIFNQHIYFIIWYLLDRASLI